MPVYSLGVIVSSIVELSSATAPACGLLWPSMPSFRQFDLFGDTRWRQQFGHDNADYQHPNQTPSLIQLLDSEAVQRRKQQRPKNQGATDCARPDQQKFRTSSSQRRLPPKNKNGSMGFRELCRKEKVRPKASTTQSPVQAMLCLFHFATFKYLYRVSSNSRQQLRNS